MDYVGIRIVVSKKQEATDQKGFSNFLREFSPKIIDGIIMERKGVYIFYRYQTEAKNMQNFSTDRKERKITLFKLIQ